MEMIKGAAASSQPAVIIAIDSLASRRTERIGCTIQLCDAGLQPGAGVGNARSGLDRQSMGVPVIAIGVPLVVYASTISRDTVGLIAGELGLMNNEESVKELAAKAISEKTGELIVTPKEIDALIGSMSAILSNAINMALFGTDHAELKSLIA
jgi:spore protease